MKNFFFAEQRLIGFADGQNPETVVPQRKELADKKIEGADGESKDKSKEINDKVAALTKKIEKMKSMSDTLPAERAKEWESFINKRIDEINANIDGNYEETEKAIQKCSEALDTAVIHGSSVIDVVREGDHATLKIPDVPGQQICISVDGHAPQYSVTRAGMHEFIVPCAQENATAMVTYTDLKTQEVTKVPLTIGRSGSINTKEIRKAEPKPKSAAPLDYVEFDQKIVEEPKKVEQSEYEKNAETMQPTEHAPDAAVIKEAQKEPAVEQSAYEQAVSDLKPTEREYEAQPSGYEQEMSKMTPKVLYEEPMEDMPTTKVQPSATPVQAEEQKKVPAPMPDVADIDNNVPPVGIPPLPTSPETASRMVPKTNEPKAATFERPNPAAPSSVTPEAKKEVPPVGIPPLPEQDKKKMPKHGNEEIRKKIREEADADGKKPTPEVKKEVAKKVDQAKETLKKEPTTVREQHEQNMEKAMRKLEKAETKGEKWTALFEMLAVAIQYLNDFIDHKLDNKISTSGDKKNTAEQSKENAPEKVRKTNLIKEIHESKGTTIDAKINDVESRKTEQALLNTSAIAGIEKEIPVVKAENNAMIQQKAGLETKLGSINGTDEASMKARAEIKTQIDALQKTIDQTMKKMQDLGKQRETLVKKNEEIQKDLAMLKDLSSAVRTTETFIQQAIANLPEPKQCKGFEFRTTADGKLIAAFLEVSEEYFDSFISKGATLEGNTALFDVESMAFQELQREALLENSDTQKAPKNQEQMKRAEKTAIDETADRLNMVINRETSSIQSEQKERSSTGYFGKFHRGLTLSDPYEINIKNSKQIISHASLARKMLAQASNETNPEKKIDLLNKARRIAGLREVDHNFAVDENAKPASAGLNRVIKDDNERYKTEQEAITASRDVGIAIATTAPTLGTGGAVLGTAARGTATLGKTVAQGAILGGVTGTASGTAKGVDDVRRGEKTVSQAVKDTATEAGTGAVVGGVLGGAFHGIGKGVEKIKTARRAPKAGPSEPAGSGKAGPEAKPEPKAKPEAKEPNGASDKTNPNAKSESKAGPKAKDSEKGKRTKPREETDRNPQEKSDAKNENPNHDNGFHEIPDTAKPWEILGVKPTATKDEVNQAWKKLAGKWANDKFNNMGMEIQEMAARNARKVNGARDYFKKTW